MKNYIYLLLISLSVFLSGFSASAAGRDGSTVDSPTTTSTAPLRVATCPAAYEEQNGIVVIETESLNLPSGWQKKTSAGGHTGSAYIDWTGAENFSKTGIGLIETTIKINKTGKYIFQWRNRVGLGTSLTDHNDTWLRFPDASDFYGERTTRKVYPYGTGKTPNPNGAGSDGWFKVYFNAGVWNWAWATYVSDRDAMQVVVEFDKPGVYKLQISARSKGHLLDRIVMFHSSVSPSSAQTLTRTETKCLGETPANQAPVVSNPIPDQVATAGTNLTYTVPSNTFSDPNADALSYSASLSTGASLPSWLTFNAASRTFSGTSPASTTLTLRVTASDGQGGQTSDDFALRINAPAPNPVPTVNAGADKQLSLPTTQVSLSGSASDNGRLVSTVWTKVSGPAATLTAANSLTLTASSLTAGTYVFRLTATDDQGATAFDEATVTVNPATVTAQQVVSLSLMNADTDQEIKLLVPGEQINLATLPTKNLNIRATTNPVKVGSVKMVLSGKQSHTQTETGFPYALFGDTGGDYKNWTPAEGSYTLTVTPYTGAGATGTAGTPLTMNFTVIDQAAPVNQAPVLASIGNKTMTLGQTLGFTAQATDADVPAQALTYSTTGPVSSGINASTGSFTWTPTTTGTFSLTIKVTDNGSPAQFAQEVIAVTVNPASPQQEVISFSLINATTDQVIKVLTNGEQINLATLASRSINIRANTNPGTVGSVKMVLSGKQSRTQTDNGAPYALFGDKDGNYNNWTPSTGSYSLTGTPYTASAAGGTAGGSLTISFTVVDQPAGARLSAEEADGLQVVLLGNPIANDEVTVSIQGAGGLPLRMQVLNMQGKTVSERQLGKAGSHEQHQLSVAGQPAGLLLLRVSTPTQTRTIKVMKIK
ncbi:putative secreted protein (Por secretion system target) [Larkinella arboricola]|uniref:Putative secreted protein (Por secretion system target) n=1 Tax=Larkinella arboricola TaxID=643671 RepID=A0A327X1H5_LARAB|nr:putative Ig domain-containing protein [Larkinella arboricola]RAK00208.1 putative secreted protein (Por secretion system target) [Larkinella arboricola]